MLAKCEASSQKKEKLLDNVVKENGKNVVRLVVVFPRATGRQISKSLDDQIGHTLQKSGHYKDFEAFSQAFTGGIKFRKGTVITFSAAKDGTLTTFIDGQKVSRPNLHVLLSTTTSSFFFLFLDDGLKLTCLRSLFLSEKFCEVSSSLQRYHKPLFG